MNSKPSSPASSNGNASIIDMNSGTAIAIDTTGHSTTNANSKPAAKRKPGQSLVTPVIAARLLKKWDLDLYLRHFPEITPEGRAYIIRSLERPARNPSGVCSNTTRHPSTKTGQTATTESDLTELPTVLMCDRSDDVLYYVEQPQEIHLSYDDGLRRAGKPSTPDFLIFYRDGPVICECKPEREMASLAIRRPYRFVQEKDGSFRSPPAEAAAITMGLRFRILTERDFDRIFLDNIRFLTAHYRSALREPVTNDEWQLVKKSIEEEPGLLFTKLPFADTRRRADVIYSLIANRFVFAHLEKVSLEKQAEVRLYLHPLEETAFALFYGRLKATPPTVQPIARLLPIGSKFRLKKDSFIVVRHKGDAIEVRSEKTNALQVIPYTTLQTASPIFDAVSDQMLPIWDLIASLSTERLEKFMYRHRLILPYLEKNGKLTNLPKDRTARRYYEAYLKEKAHSGFGERALVPPVHGRTGFSRVCEASDQCLLDLIKREFLSKKAPNAKFLFRRYIKECEKRRVPENQILSYRTVARRVENLTNYRKALERFGKRAALKSRPPRGFAALLGSPHGKGPWARAHIDHTLLDLLVDGERPWISAMVDSYDGRILAFVMWFGHPNTKIVFDLLEDCIARHGTLPLSIICDWGSEFRSRALQTALARVGISIRYRPKGEPRSGSPMETSFSSLNKRCIHNAAGNTKALKKARETTAAFQPETHACYNMADAKELMEDYMKTNNTTIREFKPSPEQMCEDYLAKYGVHQSRWISPAVLARVRQIPVDGNTRRVSEKGTVHVNTADYAADELKNLVGEEVPVFEGTDPRIVYVNDRRHGRQIICRCVTSDIAEAGTAEEAKERVKRRREGAYQRVKEADKKWAGLVDRMNDREERAKQRKADNSTQKPPIIPPASTVDNALTDAEIADIQPAS